MTNPGEIIICDSIPQMAKRGAEIFSQAARKHIQRAGRFAVALAGGSTPRTMHQLLGQEPYCSHVPWNKTHIFWVDERCVPQSNPASNYGAAKQDFLGIVPIPQAQIHAMFTQSDHEGAAMAYQKQLMEFFQPPGWGFPSFDLIFLGMGKDGHIASLFPGQKALEEESKRVVTAKGGNPDVNRITMTLPVINHAKQIVFLISGKHKAGAVKALFKNPQAGLPAQRVRPLSGNLIWLLERVAAGLL